MCIRDSKVGILKEALEETDEAGKAAAPDTFATKPALGPKFKGLTFRMQVSPLDLSLIHI